MQLLGIIKDMMLGITKLKFNRPLSGRQRNLVTLLGKIPDQIALNAGLTNINPFWVDSTKYDYYNLTHDPKLSVEYLEDTMALMPEVDWWSEPWVGGLMLSEGACECGTVFEFPKETFPYPVKYVVNEAPDLDTLKLQKGGYLEKY